MNEKVVTYKGDTYTIRYESIMERRINGNTQHYIYITKVNKEDINPFMHIPHTWITSNCKNETQQSIIKEVKKTIDNYIKANPKKEFSYDEEFKSWDGNLDGWDE